MTEYLPLVSVIVPNYNHSDFLISRIESILNQSYRNFEIILLDDNSSDQSQEILKSYSQHNKVTSIIINESNSGNTFKQWKNGISESSGELIWIAESDDLSDEKFLEYLVPEFQNEDIGCCFCGSYYIDVKGSIIRKADDMDEEVTYSKSTVFNSGFYKSNLIRNASSAIFRKSIANSFPKEALNLKFVGDWVFWMNILKSDYKILYKNKFLNYFRLHSDNVSTNAVKLNLKAKEGVVVFNFIRESFISNQNQYLILKDYWYKKFLFVFFPFRPFSAYSLVKFSYLVNLFFNHQKLFWDLAILRFKLK